MTVPPLCIIQARHASTRLPGKMLLKLGDETLIQRAWRLAGEAFGAENCVVATSYGQPLKFRQHLEDIGARVYQSMAKESDVLLRFYHVAHFYRWHPDTILHRWTPDDPWKDPKACRRVVAGERLPVEIGGEAFTLRMLDEADARVKGEPTREHITHALFAVHPPAPPFGDVWTVDTESDYERAVARYEREKSSVRLNEWHEIKEPTGGWCAGQAGRPISPNALAALRAIQESA